MGSYWLHTLGSTWSPASVQNARRKLPLPLPWQHTPQISTLEEIRLYVPNVGIVYTVSALRELIFQKGRQILNKPEKSYKTEEQGALKLLTRRLIM